MQQKIDARFSDGVLDETDGMLNLCYTDTLGEKWNKVRQCWRQGAKQMV